MAIIKPLLYELLTIIISISISFVSVVILFSQFTYLKEKELYGLNPTIEQFINWSCIIIISVLLISIIFIFPTKPYLNLISFIAFTCLSIIELILFILVVSQKTKAVNGYWYLFDEPDNMTYGMIIQKKNDCCGWDNIAEPKEMVFDCVSKNTCESVLLNYYSKRVIPVSIFLFLSFIAHGFCAVGAFLIMLNHKKPNLPEYDERLASQAM